MSSFYLWCKCKELLQYSVFIVTILLIFQNATEKKLKRWMEVNLLRDLCAISMELELLRYRMVVNLLYGVRLAAFQNGRRLG